MARVCEFCEKTVFTGNKVSHSNIKVRTRWYPNLKKVKAVIKGTTKTVKACTRCIRTGKIVRPIKRNWKPESGTTSPKTA